MLDVIETAWFRDGGRSAWLVITLGQFEARGVNRTMTKRARRDLLKRGLIDHRSGGRDPATKWQEPSVWRLTYAPMGGVEPSDKWRTYQASKAGHKRHSGGQNGSKAPFADFYNDSNTVSMSDKTGNATFDRGAKVPPGPGCKSATVKSQRLVESFLKKESQSFFPESTDVAPVSAVAADPTRTIKCADPFADGPPEPPPDPVLVAADGGSFFQPRDANHARASAGDISKAHSSPQGGLAPSGGSNSAPGARKPPAVNGAPPAAGAGFKACRYGCHGGCTEPDGVCVKLKAAGDMIEQRIRDEAIDREAQSAHRNGTSDNGRDAENG